MVHVDEHDAIPEAIEPLESVGDERVRDGTHVSPLELVRGEEASVQEGSCMGRYDVPGRLQWSYMHMGRLL